MTEYARRLVLWWLCALVLALVLGPLAVRAVYGAVPPGDTLAGAGLAALNGAVALAANRRASMASPRRFVRWGILGNVLRLTALAAILFAYRFGKPDGFAAFGLAFVAGALVFMVAEVAGLHCADARR